MPTEKDVQREVAPPRYDAIFKQSMSALDSEDEMNKKERPITKCEDCGLLYQNFPMDVTIPNDQWIKLTGYKDGEGILCGACIIQRASGRYGVARLRFEIEIDHFDREDEGWEVYVK